MTHMTFTDTGHISPVAVSPTKQQKLQFSLSVTDSSGGDNIDNRSQVWNTGQVSGERTNSQLTARTTTYMLLNPRQTASVQLIDLTQNRKRKLPPQYR